MVLRGEWNVGLTDVWQNYFKFAFVRNPGIVWFLVGKIVVKNLKVFLNF